MADRDYSQATADLIERQCRNVERKSFELDKDQAAEAILKTYDLFDLKRPTKVVWFVDIFGEEWINALRSARSARSAWSAWSARSARSARSASSARSALDYDFDWFVVGYEYNQANSDGNDNDRKYLEYSELLMQAKEAGAGYRVEVDDTLYIVPTPIVTQDDQQRFHSEEGPALYWQGGKELYYLKGESFEEDLWKRITSGEMTADEVLQISDSDQREIAFSMLGVDEMLTGLKAELIHTGIKGNKLYRCENFRDTGETEYALVMKDASTPRTFIKFVPPEVGKLGDADKATAEGYKDAAGNSLPLDQYLAMELEA